MASERDYFAIACEYAENVVDGTIPACEWVKKACQRQLDDLEREDFGYGFDVERAARVCQFAEKMPHIKGEWAKRKEKIRLEPWQIFIKTTVFGWVDSEGNRRFRTAYIEVPRKNAKSTKSSTVGLYMLCADGEEGAEVYSAATTRDQAKIVWKDAWNMVRRLPDMQATMGVATNAVSIHQLKTASSFLPLSSDTKSLDGKNVHCAVIDELHAHKTREVFDVVETGTGARSQPLLWIITTAGSNRAGICYEQRIYVTRLLDKKAEDETYFGIIYTIDEGDDWTDPAVWAKANPNYGISVKPDDIARLARKAMEMASARNNFLTKRLNVWVNADVAWMDMRKWDACGDPDLEIGDFVGERYYSASDLATKTDIAATARLFVKEIDGEDHFYFFPRFYVPESAAENDPQAQYSGWVAEGYLTETPGNVIDLDQIQEDIEADASEFAALAVGFDPWQARQMMNQLGDAGLDVFEVRATVQNFSEPMKDIEALVLSGRFHHDGNPVMAWMIANTVCHSDAKENIFPRKERPENKIDGTVALIMARALALSGEHEPSLYESDDFIV